jgi:plasmid stabilization system protein ParE
MTPLIYAPEALGDVQEILAFLGEQDPKLMTKFEGDYRKALERIREAPRAWPRVGRNVRVKVVSKRFLYGIYYQYVKKTVCIGAVIGLTRHPSRWKRRFRK